MRTLALLTLFIAAPAMAQEQLPDELDYDVDDLGVAARPAPNESLWAVLPGGPDGANDPIVRDEANYDLVAVGGVMAGITYVLAASMTIFFAAIGGCYYSCNEGWAAAGLLPILHFFAGFSNTGASVGAWISGGVFAPIELVGVLLMLAGGVSRSPHLIELD